MASKRKSSSEGIRDVISALFVSSSVFMKLCRFVLDGVRNLARVFDGFQSFPL